MTTAGRERHRAGAERVAAVERQVADLVSGADRQGLERALSILRGERRSTPAVLALEQTRA